MTSKKVGDVAVEDVEEEEKEEKRGKIKRPTEIALGHSTFNSLALDVSLAGAKRGASSSVTPLSSSASKSESGWSVVEFLEGLGDAADLSTSEEREEALREVLAETEIEGSGDLSDFLFHVARTKHGLVYIRVIRTLLLNRGVLCSNRVSQMTKTYNDIEAVTRLLEEKEKDLELTARIGKELLSHNQKLEKTISEYETELKTANEKLTQLSHELLKKTELIQILTNDVEESSSELDNSCSDLQGINLEVLHRKIGNLEDENRQLKTEYVKLAHEADDCEKQEANLVRDIANQLANANMEVDGIADELGRQKEENRLQSDEIMNLTSKLAGAELRLASLISRHEETRSTLQVTRENQDALTSELFEFKERYREVVNLLAETQEQLRKQRKRGLPVARAGGFYSSSLLSVHQPESLASELESSLYSEASLDSGIMPDRMPPFKKVFETVRTASKPSTILENQPFPRIGSMTTSSFTSDSYGPRVSFKSQSHAKSHISDYSGGQSDSESLLTDSEDYPGPQQPGIPGAPGAADLAAALRRLTPAEVLARRACLSTGVGYNYDYDGGGVTSHSPPMIPMGIRTPDSIMSTGSCGNLSGFSGHSAATWRVPEKLQIVKQMEGSQTLQQWSHLATPTLGGLLEDRPGVKTRGGRGLEDLGLETYTLADLEEDEEYLNPGKLFQDTSSVYTFTNCTVLHPDDHTSVTPSIVGSCVASATNSVLNSGMSTPRSTLSRRNSTSTFSTALGLAKMLNERGIKAVTPSCVATPNEEHNFTPTATPCNSPDPNSACSSRPESPSPMDALTFGLFSSGADLLKRTFIGGEVEDSPAATQQRRSTGGIKKRLKSGGSSSRSTPQNRGKTLTPSGTKLEFSGIESMSPLALPGSIYTRRTTESPMAQLTFLKSSMSTSSKEDAGEFGDMLMSSSTSNESLASVKVGGKNSGDSNFARSSRRRRPGATRSTRPDLGQVKPPTTQQNSAGEAQSSSSAFGGTLGTLSSLLFGRKGGLL